MLISTYKYITQRVEFIKLLSKREMSVGEVVQAVKLPQPKVSNVLKELKSFGLLKVRNDGKVHYFSVDRQKITEYINDIKKILSDLEVDGSNELIVRRKVLFSN